MASTSDDDRPSPVPARKLEHLELALVPPPDGVSPAGWDDVRLIPTALPERSLDDVDLGADLLGHHLRAPLVLVPMTGGHPDLGPVNAALGETAEHLGLAVGVGSQRAALEDPDLEASFRAVRDRAPSAMVLANLGACQLLAQGGRPALRADQVRRALDMVGADVLTVHLNVAQEVVQTEGDRTTGPFLPALEALVARCEVPVLVKETGSGMTGGDARRLAEAGVAAIDVGGAGGTSFVTVEGVRADRAGDARGTRLGSTFRGWGVPTAAAVLEVVGSPLAVVATGGIRHGLDAARALALGATAVGLGRVAATAARHGAEACIAELTLVIEELRIATLLCGADSSAALGEVGVVLDGPTLSWAQQRRLGLHRPSPPG